MSSQKIRRREKKRGKGGGREKEIGGEEYIKIFVHFLQFTSKLHAKIKKKGKHYSFYLLHGGELDIRKDKCVTLELEVGNKW